MSAIFNTAALGCLLCASLLGAPRDAKTYVLSFYPWTNGSGAASLLFLENGEGSLDGRRFCWQAEEGGVTLRFAPGCAFGAQQRLELLICGSSPALLGADVTYIPGDASGSDALYAQLGREIADYALQFEGCKYLYGGKDPETGFDCSGLIYYVFGQFGYELHRVAADQAKDGKHIEPWALRAGDIICFKSGSYIGHVGLYIGDNRFIHAECSATGVVIGELADYYEQRGYEARRIVGAVERSEG